MATSNCGGTTVDEETELYIPTMPQDTIYFKNPCVNDNYVL